MNNFKKKNIIGVIPARGGSKGVPRKNIKSLARKPLIAWSIETALKSGCLDRIIVSTEDKEISEISKKYGAEVIKRPKFLAEDNSPIIETLKHLLSFLEKKNNLPEMFVLLQPTSPLRQLKTISLAIKKFENNYNKYDSLIPLYPIEGKIGKIKNGYYNPEYTPGKRRQDLDNTYLECGTIFIFKPSIIKKGKLFGDRIFPFVVEKYEEAIDIDNINDFQIAEYFINLKNKI